MIKQKTHFTVLTFLTSIASIIWIGSYISRFSVFYNIFSGPELTINSFLNNEALYGLLYGMYAPLGTSIFSYFVFLVFFYLTIFSSGLSLKRHGWLFISLIMVTLTAPLELYLVWKYDLEIFFRVYSTKFNPQEIIDFYITRIKTFSFMPFVMILTVITLFGLFIFRPLEMTGSSDET